MDNREKRLEEALWAFMKLDWQPDSAPGPSYYMVWPVLEARKAMQEAGKLLDGQSPFSLKEPVRKFEDTFSAETVVMATFFPGK